MKKLAVILLMLTALSAQAQTYDWEIEPGLSTSWTVYTHLIRVTVRSDNLDIFCDRHFIIIQNGMMELSESNAKPSDAKAFMMYRPGYTNCGTLYPGMVGEAVIYQFPGWFNAEKAFRIIYLKNLNSLKIFDIPEEPRLAMPELSDSVPDNATCASLRTKGLFGFRTHNSMDFCAWTVNYGEKKAVYFNALVTNGAITLVPEDITLFQGVHTVTSLSYWADNSTSAILYCPDCNSEIQAGGAITGAIYELPLSWDLSLPFTLRFQGQDITIIDRSSCAAAYVLAPDDAGLAALRSFRDRHLAGSAAGRKVISLYYRLSPRLIAILEQRPLLRKALQSGASWLAVLIQ